MADVADKCKLEDRMNAALHGEAKANALDFAALPRANGFGACQSLRAFCLRRNGLRLWQPSGHPAGTVRAGV